MKNILIVDDDPNIAILVKMALSVQPEYAVDIVNSGPEALDFISRSMPDLVLLDIMMPGMDGFEVCRRIKAEEETRYLPIIMITAKTDMQDKVHGMDIGANDYITKPFNPDELLARVKAHLRIKELEAEVSEKAKLDTALQTSITLQHEINNPLTGIIGNLELLEDWASMPTDEINETIKEIEGLAFRIRDIVKKMNKLTRVVTTDYIPGSEMLDLSGSSDEEKSGA